MPTISTSDFPAFLNLLPDWSSHDEALDTEILIVAAGFEDRSTAIFSRWLSKSNRKKICVIIKYTTNLQDNEVTLERFRKRLASASVEHIEITYDQKTLGHLIAKSLGRVKSRWAILVDISTLASFAFFPLFSALFDILEENRINVAYTEAEDYFPSKEEWEIFSTSIENKDLVELADIFDSHTFQSRGTEAIFECPSFIGKNPDDLPGKLIVIPNFSFHRVFTMVEYAYRSYSIKKPETEWIIGSPPDKIKNGWRTGAIFQLFKQPKLARYCCTLLYKDLLEQLQTTWESSYFDRSLFICTMASKAQNLAIFLFLKLHPECSLILSEPTSFLSKQYSSGVGRMHFLQFPIVSGLKSQISTWNKINFDWKTLNEV